MGRRGADLRALEASLQVWVASLRALQATTRVLEASVQASGANPMVCLKAYLLV